jgi:CBS domain-containing protein
MSRRRIRDVHEAEPLSKAFELLDQSNVGALPVKSSEGKYSGVISKSDIASIRLLKLLNGGRTPDTILVREVMNRTAPLYVMETASVQEAVTLMHKRGIHRLFVADARYQLIGVVSTSDILRLLVLG